MRTAAVEAAFRAVPRHVFLPDVGVEDVYTDRAFPTKHADGRPISSSSQPAIMAIMLEQLALQPGQRVLEIGAGTGYNAALITHLVRNGGQVVTIDIDEDVVVAARQHLAAAGFDRVDVRCADGGYGDPEGAPFDRIILTASAWDITPAWFEQLTLGGRLVLPLGLRQVQQSVAFERHQDHLESVSVAGCGFMPLRGDFAGPQRVVALSQPPGPFVAVEGDRPIDPNALSEALKTTPMEVPTGITATVGEACGSLSLWLALEDPDSCLFSIYGDPSVVDRSAVPLSWLNGPPATGNNGQLEHYWERKAWWHFRVFPAASWTAQSISYRFPLSVFGRSRSSSNECIPTWKPGNGPAGRQRTPCGFLHTRKTGALR